MIVAACLALAACGFRPLYNTGSTLGGGETILDSIAIEKVSGLNSNSVMLKNALIDRFYNNGYPDQPLYTLTIQLEELHRNIVIQKDDTSTRGQAVMRARYTLVNKATNQPVDQGDIRAVSSYNILQSQYTTLVTQNQARELAIRELANKITTRMAVVLEQTRK